ncbi:class I SAM-dependent methyltransferase [Kribbella solani]|uniref:class I SAM-dependent methyltransferase n=1 Tax=Kribbella solani TaxID=236067 RepID=UPI0029AC04FA|nr:class I SAM-dependent methyltransferase [Kribbella solani]MDX2971273.1 class I SAM-dependent methyltransferase [Kribbella solani]MDX3000075.1 class I SAM-dependent methyltransferase [Kribbella solani]
MSFNCRGCSGENVVPVVDLGAQPCADYFPAAETPGPDPRWPLELWLCRDCTLVQLGPVEAQLPEEPLAVESATSLAHAEASVKEILRDYPELAGKVVCEFASHHGGSWLGHLSAAGSQLAAAGQQADLVIDVHGIVHEPQYGDMLKLRAERLAPGGLLVMEFHHLLPLFIGNQFDTIRHGHWAYVSLRALRNVAALHGLAVESVKQVEMYGGSLMVMLRHTADAEPDASVDVVLADEDAAGIADEVQLGSLQEAAWHAADALHAELTRHKDAGRTVLAYGAPSKAPVLLDLSKVTTDLLPFTVDIAPGKHGRRIPGGCMVPIRPVADLTAAQPDVVLVLTWDIADEVVAQLEADGGWGATYLVPLPEPHERGF